MQGDDDNVIAIFREPPEKRAVQSVLIGAGATPEEDAGMTIILAIIHGVQMIQRGRVIGVVLFTSKEKAEKAMAILNGQYKKVIKGAESTEFKIEEYPVY